VYQRELLRPCRLCANCGSERLCANEEVFNNFQLLGEPLRLDIKELRQRVASRALPKLLGCLREREAFSALLCEKEEHRQVALVVGAATPAAIAWLEDSHAPAPLVAGALNVTARQPHEPLDLGNLPSAAFGSPHALTSFVLTKPVQRLNSNRDALSCGHRMLLLLLKEE
jgi:hypothetical protein